MICTVKPGGWTFAALVTAILGGGGLAYLSRAGSGQPPALTIQLEQASFAAEPITPLPTAVPLDNRKVELGRRLFHDIKLSGDGSVSWDRHSFKGPSLRNVALPQPYLHDGSAKTLEAAVRVMVRYQLGEQLDEGDLKKIVAFLHTLTGEYQGSRSNEAIHARG